jgi:hypothetical protein
MEIVTCITPNLEYHKYVLSMFMYSQMALSLEIFKQIRLQGIQK